MMRSCYGAAASTSTGWSRTASLCRRPEQGSVKVKEPGPQRERLRQSSAWFGPCVQPSTHAAGPQPAGPQVPGECAVLQCNWLELPAQLPVSARCGGTDVVRQTVSCHTCDHSRGQAYHEHNCTAGQLGQAATSCYAALRSLSAVLNFVLRNVDMSRLA